MLTERRQLPPYAKGLKPLGGWVWIRCGEAGWRMHRGGDAAALACEIIYPADKPPSVYLWPVAGCHCLVFGLNAPQNRVAELCLELLSVGAQQVYLHDQRFGAQVKVYSRAEYLEHYGQRRRVG